MISVYTDGACSGNPGKGGWGAVILADGKELPMNGGELSTTNNRMELTAAINALQKISDTASWRTRRIEVFSDSQYVKNGICSWISSWKRNGWQTSGKQPVKNRDLWLKLDALNTELSVEWKWVKGHAGNKYNEWCDSLATAFQKQ
ncbi:MAG: ribonuclease HI [Treponema brennaborense]|nr:ribonuclease HI [Treponema brennaborense]